MSRSSEAHDVRMAIQDLDQLVYTLGNGPIEVVTTPPDGMLKVRNIYFNPSNGRFRFEYDDET